MEFKIEERTQAKTDQYSQEELDIAREFCKRMSQEFGNFLKALVLFGSHAKRMRSHDSQANQKSDIDILVVTNDVTVTISKELSETYRVITERIVQQVSEKIHVTTLRFTNFWELVRNGDPVSINILRDGVALIDTGVFDPLQALLYQGRIRPTWESIYSYYQRAPNTLQNSRWHISQATVDLYWAVVDAAHAALMRMGEIPPSPSHIADLLHERMYKKGRLAKRYVSIMRNFHHLAKGIMKRDIKEIKGSEYEKHYRDATDFVEAMKRIIEQDFTKESES